MPSMRAVLERREKSALARVEELRAELERVRDALAEAEEVLKHRVIGLEQYLEALAEQDVPTVTDSGQTTVVQVVGEEPWWRARAGRWPARSPGWQWRFSVRTTGGSCPFWARPVAV